MLLLFEVCNYFANFVEAVLNSVSAFDIPDFTPAIT